MNNFIKIVSFTSILLLSYGCATNKYKAPNDVLLNEQSDYGLAILSINLLGTPKGFHYIVKSDDDSLTFMAPEYSLIEGLSPLKFSDFPKTKEKLVAFKLPEGKYKFVEWFHYSASQYSSYEIRSKQDFPIYFDVKKNKASYIGNISQNNKRNGIFIKDSGVTITDKSKRDIPVFLSQYPNILDKKVSINIAYKLNDNTNTRAQPVHDFNLN